MPKNCFRVILIGEVCHQSTLLGYLRRLNTNRIVPMTLNIVAHIMTLSIMTLSIMTPSIIILSIMTLSIMTLSIMTFSIMTFNASA